MIRATGLLQVFSKAVEIQQADRVRQATMDGRATTDLSAFVFDNSAIALAGIPAIPSIRFRDTRWRPANG
jgi:hypothetical protein